MEKLHQYVPKSKNEGIYTLPTGETITYDDTKFHQILLGGDQLTVARARSAQVLRSTRDSAVSRLSGLEAVVEDFHCRMTLMKVLLLILSENKLVEF